MTTDATGAAEGAVESPEANETPAEETAALTPGVKAVETEDDGPEDSDAEPDRHEGIEDVDSISGEDADDAEEGDDDSELIEFNFGGNKLEVPKGALPEELEAKVQSFSDDIWADYTKGKQANAEAAKTIATNFEAIAKLTSLNGEALQTYSRGLQVRQEIEHLSQFDVNALWQSNPDQARKISDALASKKAEFQNIVARVGQQEHAIDAAQQDELVRRSHQGRAVLDRQFKDFSTEKAPEVVKYAVEKGMAQADAEQWALNPLVTEMAYKAMLYDRMHAAPKKARVTPAEAKPVVPMKTTGKATRATNDPGDMDMEAYAKWRGAGGGE